MSADKETFSLSAHKILNAAVSLDHYEDEEPRQAPSSYINRECGLGHATATTLLVTTVALEDQLAANWRSLIEACNWPSDSDQMGLVDSGNLRALVVLSKDLRNYVAAPPSIQSIAKLGCLLTVLRTFQNETLIYPNKVMPLPSGGSCAAWLCEDSYASIECFNDGDSDIITRKRGHTSVIHSCFDNVGNVDNQSMSALATFVEDARYNEADESPARE